MINGKQLLSRGALAALAVVAPSMGCFHGPRMAIPGDLAREAQELTVVESLEGARDTRYSFGPYSVSNMVRARRRSGEGFKVDLPFVKTKDTTVGGYSYRFQAPGSDLRAECGWQHGEERRVLPIGKVSSPIANMECRCEAGSLAARARMGIDDKGRWVGKVDVHGTVYDLVPVDRYASGGQSVTPRGYSVHAPEGTVAAIETVGLSRVWLVPSLDQRSQTELSCVLSGLMFYAPPGAG